MAALGCAREAVPTELIGRWTSDDPRYENRSLEIGAEQIVFGVDAGIRISYRLRGVELETNPATGVLYRLVYEGSGEPERELQVRIPTPGRLRIENHSEVWTRSDAPGLGS
jgi:hypothetical protein